MPNLTRYALATLGLLAAGIAASGAPGVPQRRDE